MHGKPYWVGWAVCNFLVINEMKVGDVPGEKCFPKQVAYKVAYIVAYIASIYL